MLRNKLSRYFLFISIATFITILVVIIQKGYHNLMQPVRQAQNSNLLKPINPVLDNQIIDQLESKMEYTPSQIIISPVSTDSSSHDL
jgi:hypothetical protein